MSIFLGLIVGLNFLINLNNQLVPNNKWTPVYIHVGPPDLKEIMNDVHLHLKSKLTDLLWDQSSKEEAEKMLKLFEKIMSVPMKETESQREARIITDEARLKEWDKEAKKQRSILDGEKEQLEQDKEKVKTDIRNHAEEKRKLEEERKILAREKEEQIKQKEENENQRRTLSEDKAAFENERETKTNRFADWESKLREKEEELYGKETKIKEDKVQFHEKKEKAVNAIQYVALVVILGGVIVVYKLVKKPSGGTGVDRTPRLRVPGAAELDICHISLTRERNTFFTNVLLPRLAESDIRPRTQCCLLLQSADFADIPPARCYIVHWTSQRMSIYSTSWHHQGLLRALGDSPVMIIVYDSERIQTLPEPKIYDDAFRQIETERELCEAASERRLMTYRANEQFNQTQNQTLRNWVSHNIGVALNV